MQSETVAARPTPANTPQAKSKSPWRILHERLQKADATPRAARIAVALEAYARQEFGTGRMIAAVYHAKLAAETRMSVANVRRALHELSTGDAPLYVARGRTGHKRTIRFRGGSERTTSAVVYERIDDLDAFLVQRDVARTANVLDYEARKREHRPELLKAQVALLKGEIAESDYQAEVERIDARARRGLPKAATTPKPTRCLTPAQVEQFADDWLGGARYADLAAEGAKRVRQFHALERHVFGGNGRPGCPACELSVAQHATATHRYFTEHLKGQATTCGCGAVIIIVARGGAVAFADVASGSGGVPWHDCPHEQNRLLRLRVGAHP